MQSPLNFKKRSSVSMSNPQSGKDGPDGMTQIWPWFRYYLTSKWTFQWHRGWFKWIWRSFQSIHRTKSIADENSPYLKKKSRLQGNLAPPSGWNYTIFKVPQPSARAQPQDSAREQRYHTRLDENEFIKRERCNTDTVDHIFNTMSQIYKQARKYYRKKPEHVLLHIVVLLWTIILFAIMTK